MFLLTLLVKLKDVVTEINSRSTFKDKLSDWQQNPELVPAPATHMEFLGHVGHSPRVQMVPGILSAAGHSTSIVTIFRLRPSVTETKVKFYLSVC